MAERKAACAARQHDIIRALIGDSMLLSTTQPKLENVSWDTNLSYRMRFHQRVCMLVRSNSAFKGLHSTRAAATEMFVKGDDVSLHVGPDGWKLLPAYILRLDYALDTFVHESLQEATANHQLHGVSFASDESPMASLR